MKKILSLLAVFAMCISCFSCDDDKDEDDISETVSNSENTVDSGDTVVEQQFREFEESDFQTLNVPLTFTEEEAPVTLNKFEIPELDFGKRIAPCKKSDDPSQFDPIAQHPYTWTDENGVEHKSESTYMKLLDTPEDGMLTTASFFDNKVYLNVTFDNFCIGCHEWSVYEYDTEKMDMREIYKYSGISKEYATGFWVSPVLGNDDKMMMSGYKSDEPEKNVLISVDRETGEEKVVYESDSYINITNSRNGILMAETENINNSASRLRLTINEYDTDTGELRNIADKVETKMYHFVGSELNAYLMKPLDSRKCRLVTEHYSIGTDITNGNVVYASDKKAIMYEGNCEVLHTFDLEKMEHYVTELGEKSGQIAACGENLILGDSFSSRDDVTNIYYIIPDIGLVFTLAENISADIFKTNGDTVTFSSSKEEIMSLDEDDSFRRGYSKPTAVYWVTEQ